jgi:prepilin-type N-terminal cleavage/methylation domain-containing protein
MRLDRRGYTLAELLIALSLGAVVIGLGSMIGFRQQRFHRDVVVAVERADEISELVALLPVSLRAIAPGEGDIAAGAARDTSIEFRATIASAAVCDSATSTVLLSPVDVVPRLLSVVTRPEPGDTAWFLDTSGSLETWVPRSITAVIDSSATCRLGTSAPFGAAPRTSLALRLASPPPARSAVVRMTRPWRYSVYRASDGRWYFGAKEWNAALVRFNTIQPVAGPLLSASAGGLRFRYLDSLGAVLPAVPPDPRRIASVEVGLRVDSVIPGAYSHATTVRAGATVVIGLRNRAR